MMITYNTKPIPHKEAAKTIANKPVVTRDVFDKMPAEIQANAFMITGIEDFDVLQGIRDRIADIPAGANWDDVKKDIMKDMSPWFNEKAAEKRAKILMNHHGFSAYAAAQARSLDELRDIFPYLQYLSRGDGTVRPSHAALHGIIVPSDHSFWDTHTPPWEWNCHCRVAEMMEGDVAEEAKRDKKRKASERRVLEGPALKQLDQGQVNRGPAVNVDIRTPKERGGNYENNVRLHGMDYDQIKGRWDRETQEGFESWADKVKMDDGRSLADTFVFGKSPKNAMAGKPRAMGMADAIKSLGLDAKDQWERKDLGGLFSAMKVTNPVLATEVLGKIRGAKATGALTRRDITATVQEALDILPREVAKTLPPLNVTVTEFITDANGKKIKGRWGQHQPLGKEALIRIASGGENLKGLTGAARKAEVKRVISHELMHWIHQGTAGPKADAYRKAVATHYAQRMAAAIEVPDGKGGFIKKAGFWSDYAQKEYKEEKGKPRGLEVPSVYFELWKNPDELLKQTSGKDKKSFLETWTLIHTIFE